MTATTRPDQRVQPREQRAEKANVLRNPGWQLAADAKKINPNLKVSILTWRTPSWVKTDEDKYIWYKQSILDAYEKYGYMVDYINPNTNEEWGGAGDVAYTKKFAKWIAAESTKTIADEKALALFKKIKLVGIRRGKCCQQRCCQQVKG